MTTSVTLQIEITAPGGQKRSRPGRSGYLFEDRGQSGFLTFERCGILCTDRDGDNGDVDRGDGHERNEDREREIATRVLHFFAGGGHGVEADVREEDDSGGGHDAMNPNGAKSAK